MNFEETNLADKKKQDYTWNLKQNEFGGNKFSRQKEEGEGKERPSF